MNIMSICCCKLKEVSWFYMYATYGLIDHPVWWDGKMSSTEAELIGTNDVTGQIIWTWKFLNEQGYTLESSTVFQDNKSAILLEKNGTLSSSKRTKHINTLKIVSRHIIVEYVTNVHMMDIRNNTIFFQ